MHISILFILLDTQLNSVTTERHALVLRLLASSHRITFILFQRNELVNHKKSRIKDIPRFANACNLSIPHYQLH